MTATHAELQRKYVEAMGTPDAAAHYAALHKYEMAEWELSLLKPEIKRAEARYKKQSDAQRKLIDQLVRRYHPEDEPRRMLGWYRLSTKHHLEFAGRNGVDPLAFAYGQSALMLSNHFPRAYMMRCTKSFAPVLLASDYTHGEAGYRADLQAYCAARGLSVKFISPDLCIHNPSRDDRCVAILRATGDMSYRAAVDAVS